MCNDFQISGYGTRSRGSQPSSWTSLDHCNFTGVNLAHRLAGVGLAAGVGDGLTLGLAAGVFRFAGVVKVG